MAEPEDDAKRLSPAELRAEVQLRAHKSRPGGVARQVESTRKLIDESHKLLLWIKTLRLV